MAAPLLTHLKAGLARTRARFAGRLHALVAGRTVDESIYEDLEEVLLGADAGLEATTALVAGLRERVQKERIRDAGRLPELLKEQVRSLIAQDSAAESDGAPDAVRDGIRWADAAPTVVLVVGVNGVGKTTTIGKLAVRTKDAGHRPLLAAADTFRAAAVAQLGEWARRADVDFVHHGEAADPAAVAFDAVQAARARDRDLVLVDTAGRLHTKNNLMAELEKIRRVVGRAQEGAPHDVLLVIDATTGQNALLQARAFHEAVQVGGIVLTKLDGTAKGGMVLAIAKELGLPIRFVGLGETAADLRPFDADAFIEALFATD